METQVQKPTNPLLAKFPDLKGPLDTLDWMHGTFEDVPSGKHSFALMGEAGDTKHMWDKNNEVEVEAARTLYKSLTKKGYRAFRVQGKDGDRGEQMTDFDASAERVIMVPPMQGG